MMISSIKLTPIEAELCIRDRKLNISFVFISQSYFKVPKHVRLNSTYFFIMKTPNKKEFHLITINHLSDIDFKDSMKIYKKFTAGPYSFLINDAALARDGPLEFKKFLSERIIMAINKEIKDKKLQYKINREAGKISAMPSSKIDKYEYLTSEKILSSGPSQVIEQAKFTYSPLVKAFEK